jgi:8-oxo-dGTP diphosphatase
MAGLFQAGVKVLIRNREGKFLLILSHDRGWEIPGGQVDKGEDPLTALHREVDEEVGIRIGELKLGGIYLNQEPPPRLTFWFLAEMVSGEPRVSEEVREIAWCAREEVLPMITHPAFRDRIRDLLDFDGRVRYRVFRSSPFLKDLKYETISETYL